MKDHQIASKEMDEYYLWIGDGWRVVWDRGVILADYFSIKNGKEVTTRRVTGNAAVRMAFSKKPLFSTTGKRII